MKTALVFFAALASLSFTVAPAHLQDQDGAASRPKPAKLPKVEVPAMQDMADGMKRYMAACKPGKDHEWLAALIGKWNVTTRMWMMGPASKPRETKGTCEIKWMMEGRWLVREMQGEMMMRPWKCTSVLGYDNFKKKYVCTTIDSLSTAMIRHEGVLDQAQTAMILYGQMDEPMTGEVAKPIKYITRILDADHFTDEVHDLAIGETNTKVVEFVYSRAP